MALDLSGPADPGPSGGGTARTESCPASPRVARGAGAECGAADGPADGLSLALRLDALPSADLHTLLESLEPLARVAGGDLSDDEVIEVVAAWARIESAAAAAVRRWASALGRRPSTRPDWGPVRDKVSRRSTASIEVQYRLGVSAQRARRLLGEGVVFDGELSDVGRALARGAIDSAKAAAFADALIDVDLTVSMAVTDIVLPRASELPLHEVKRCLQREIVRCDPQGASRRHQVARQKRRVDQVAPLPHGMARLSAVLPAADATAVYSACEAAARAARGGGDGRTLDQLRADALAAMGFQALSAGRIEAHGAGGAGMLVPAAAEAVDRAAGQANRRSVTSSGSSSEAARPMAFVFSGPASRLSLTLPRSWASVLSEHDSSPAGVGETLPAPPAARATTPADLVTWLMGFDPLTGDELPPGSPLPSELLPHVLARPSMPGVDVAHLHGYGALDRESVRALVDSGAPVTVRVAEAPVACSDGLPGHADHPAALEPPPSPPDRHDPSPALSQFVRERDRTCTAPGCTVPATSCDTDHVIPFPEGPTTAPNLRSTCRLHHLMKTHADFAVAAQPDGGTTWTTRAGQVLTRAPDGSVTRLSYASRMIARSFNESPHLWGRTPPDLDCVAAELPASSWYDELHDALCAADEESDCRQSDSVLRS